MLTTAEFHAGLDVGSTTLKIVVVNPSSGEIVFSTYRRHNTDIAAELNTAFNHTREIIGNNARIALTITGSAGMGLAESYDIPFLQEVIAAAEVVKQRLPNIRTLIDIGGEDAKMIFFDPERAPDIRMNGSCAGGTGAFIDQVATLLNVEVSELDALAQQAQTLHPIASRCGVFAKTDIQNLLARNVPPADIVASAFHAVAIQVVTTLARGRDIQPNLLLCGGPLAFITSLRTACLKAMAISEDECTVPENAALIPALGCAIAKNHARLTLTVDELLARFADTRATTSVAGGAHLPTLFNDGKHYSDWKKSKEQHALPRIDFLLMKEDACYLGIDSGSTTTKIVAIDNDEKVLFTFYDKNAGNPLATVKKGLIRFQEAAAATGTTKLRIASAAVTGYGEDLIRAAFNFDKGLVETIAHYLAAHKLNPEVNFILDIGGQDMKAAFIENGAIVRLDINEACSSGCGSFIEGFANSLGHTATDFAASACHAKHPCDLGTRCTVFMNSKVKQSLREGSTLSDIASGLAYSVVKNCLYKVLKLKSPEELGAHIVVQGGTMRNHAVVRALEQLTRRDVAFADTPELMGAYGAALHALRHHKQEAIATRPLTDLTKPLTPNAEESVCPGCENHCHVRKYTFDNQNVFYSGNKCEKFFSNRGDELKPGKNIYPFKYNRLARKVLPTKKAQEAIAGTRAASLNIGIPRALNYYENHPFWRTLFTEAGIKITLSERSTFDLYEKGVGTVMSDNICFPAKLVHGHIFDLLAKKVDRIFMPFVVFERFEDTKTAKSFNCPIVTGYSDVIRSAINPEQKYGVPLDSPSINFNDAVLLEKACRQYMVDTLGVPATIFAQAFQKAQDAQKQYIKELSDKAQTIAKNAADNKRLLIVLAGRPYHTDHLIQHRVAEMISDFGVDVINEDIVRSEELEHIEGRAHSTNQWVYSNRILKAAHWTAQAPTHVHFVQLTSFGCGPDAFMNDEIGDTLRRSGKSHTLLKVDDINNLGSLRLRIRSLVESLAYRRLPALHEETERVKEQPVTFAKKAPPPLTTPAFTLEDRRRTILAPFFSEVYSPLIPSALGLMGYKVETLPPADEKSIDYGLKYANNEVCYPATLVVGDIIRALKSGRYHPDDIAIGITQTGGQCRASSYLGLIKKAMINAGYENIPVVSVGTTIGAASNDQPGFELNFKGNIRLITIAVLFADCIGQMYHAAAPREPEKGNAARLRDNYMMKAARCVSECDTGGLYQLLHEAVKDFNAISDAAKIVPKIGIVGEIYVKYNSIGNKNIIEWLIEQSIEPVVAPLSSFFLQELPNMRANVAQNLKHAGKFPFVDKLIYGAVRYYQKKLDRIASKFRHYLPFPNIYHEARQAQRVINLAGQYGEGWLIPAEFISFAQSNITNAVSLQPFGCIANHVVAKGIEKRVRDLYPQMNMLFLDLDSGASEANLFNRLHFMVQNARADLKRIKTEEAASAVA